MADIVLNHVKKVYSEQNTAVENFNLEIADGEFVVLVGPSGCGKSTTLRMIAGLEECTEGEIYIDGQLVNGVEPRDRDVAMVFQSYALYRHMTVFDNMAFTLKLSKVPKKEIKQRVEQVSKALEIGHLLHRKPSALSGGECQRVALGRALVKKRKVYLFDEPLSNLDAKLRSAMRAELIRLHEELGATFVYVTHDQTEAMTMGDRIVVMNKGHIMQCDTPQNIYANPANIFTAGFIGTPQINFIPASMIPTFSHMDATAGVRPEAVLIGEGEILGRGCIEFIEHLGASMNVHVNIEGTELVLTQKTDMSLKRQDEVLIGVNKDGIRLFDRQTGIAVAPEAAVAEVCHEG